MKRIRVKRRKPWTMIARCKGDQQNVGCGRTWQLNKNDIVKKNYQDIANDCIVTKHGFSCPKCGRFTPLHPSWVPWEIKSQCRFAEPQQRKEICEMAFWYLI